MNVDKKMKAQYALAGIVPLLVFSFFMLGNIQPLLEVDAVHRFADDGAYIGLAAAAPYKEAQVYGLSIYEAMPATRDTLWHAIQMGVSWFTTKAPQVVLGLNFLFALLAIRLTFFLARFWCPGPLSTFVATLLFALLPLTMLSSLQGGSLALMLCLGAAACSAHLKGVDGDRAPLSFRTAFFVGLAAMLHVESVLLWPLFALHAFLVLPFTKRKGVVGTTLFHFIQGVFIIGICLWPLIHWNVLTMQVPWPTHLGLVQDVQLFDPALAFVSGGLGILLPFVVLGGLGLLAISFKNARMRLLLPVHFLPILLSLGLSFTVVYTGRGGVSQVFFLLMPLVVTLSIAGIAYLPSLLGDFKKPVVTGVVGLAGALVMGFFLVQATAVQRDELVLRVGEVQVERQAWAEHLKNYNDVSKIATDRPGWAAYQLGAEVVDLTGRSSWKLLSCRNAEGGIDLEMYAHFLSDAKPELLVAWNAHGKEMARVMREETSVVSSPESSGNTSAQWFSLP